MGRIVQFLKKHKFIGLAFVFLIVFLLSSCANSNSSSAQTKRRFQSSGSRIVKNNSRLIPTFFFHGYGSSINAEKHMVNAAVKCGVTRSVMTAIVQPSGQVSLSGRISKNAKRPIVMVGFKNNTNASFTTDAKYAYNAIKAVQRRYHFNQMNLAGHSMGNMAIMFLLLNYGNRQSFPTLRHQVDLAGHFNGIRGVQSEAYSSLEKNGRPRKMESNYRTLLKLRKTYPTTSSVMNIYGDLQNGTHSDGDVPVNSARSLKFLVSSRARHYEEHEIFGRKAQHSNLHRNSQVDNLLIRFLWNK